MNLSNREFDPERRKFLFGAGITAALAAAHISIRPAEALSVPVKSSFEEMPAVASAEPIFTSSFLVNHEINPVIFKRQIISRIRAGEQPISSETAVNAINDPSIIPPGLKTFWVTADDGLATQKVIPGVLREIEDETGWSVPVLLGIMTQFGHPTDPIEQIPLNTPTYIEGNNKHSYLTLGEVIDLMQSGIEFADHTPDHAILSKLSIGDRNAQLVVGEERLDKIYEMAGIPRKKRILVFPNGDYSGQLEVVESLEFDLALSTERTTAHPRSTKFHSGRILP